MRWTELAQKGKVPLAYITGKNEESKGPTCETPADFHLNNNRLDLAYRQLDHHSFSKLRNGVADRRVSEFDVPFDRCRRCSQVCAWYVTGNHCHEHFCLMAATQELPGYSH